MIDLDPASGPLWEPADLADILLHRLAVPVWFQARTANAADLAGAVGLGTYGDLLAHPAPPVAMLEQLRDAAKWSADPRQDAPLPREVAGLLYYASLAAALVRQRRRITTLRDEQLLHGLRWAAAQDWAADSLRSLCAAAADLVASGGPPPPAPTT